MSTDDAHRPPQRHAGPAHSAPYPVSRLAPSFSLTDLASEIEQADLMVSSRVNAQLEVIAEQVKALQAQARAILEQAHADQRLHHARCAFRRIPGKVYHLYEQADGELVFSMLSPDDWRGQPPHRFVGSYRLGVDMRWAPADTRSDDGNHGRDLITRLLAAGSDDHSGGKAP